MEILETQNAAWGFFGTMDSAGEDAAAAWAVAFEAIADATFAEGDDLEGVRGFLDSRDGRHFADAVVDAMSLRMASLDAAVADAVAQHMSWKIGLRASADYGIPRGLPYLTGWCQHYAIEANFA